MPKRKDHMDTNKDDPFITPKTIQRPPYTITLANGESSPEFGPATKSEEYKVQKEFRTSTAGGGLWDAKEVQSVKPSKNQKEPLHDHVEMLEYLTNHGHKLSMRMLEVMLHLYEGNISIKKTARRVIGKSGKPLSHETVKSILNRVRLKMKKQAESDPFEEQS